MKSKFGPCLKFVLHSGFGLIPSAVNKISKKLVCCIAIKQEFSYRDSLAQIFLVVKLSFLQ